MKKEIPQEIQDFGEKALPILSEYGMIKNKSNVFLIVIIGILGVVLISVLFYSVQIGAFKSNINQTQNVAVEPQIDVKNDYKFSPLTTNTFNNTINNTILLPANLCNCNCA